MKQQGLAQVLARLVRRAKQALGNDRPERFDIRLNIQIVSVLLGRDFIEPIQSAQGDLPRQSRIRMLPENIRLKNQAIGQFKIVFRGSRLAATQL